MSMDSWVETLKPDDMPTEDTRLIADYLGVEVTLILMNELSGMTLIIPKNGLSKIKNKYICENYDGTKKSRLILGLECKVTEQYIRKLIYREKSKHAENN